MDHVKKVFTLLIFVIMAFAVARAAMVKPSFGEFGWYRGDSVADNMDRSLNYAQSQSCGAANCHENIYNVWNSSSHTTVNCETCHGPSQAHVDDVKISVAVNDTREFCGLCHSMNPSRPKNFPQVDFDTHGENLRCVYCHNPHKPWFL